jgi:endoglucanase
MIEDADDGNNQILVQDGRSGYIYTYVDGLGSQITPAGTVPFTTAEGGANGTARALRIRGQLAPSGSFAALGLNFTDPRGPYDMSRYRGVSFYAKRGANSTGRVRFKVPDQYTDPTAKKCAKCANDFGIPLHLTEEWQQFIIPFGQLQQESGWGVPRPRSVDEAAAYAMHFHVADPGQPFDIWVDQIAFTGCP